MGAFDDLIPAEKRGGGGGAFDDLIPKKTAAPAAPEKDYGVLGNVIGGIVEPIASMASGAVAKPVSEVMGLSALARQAFPGAPTGTGADPRAFQQDVQRRLTYEPKTPAGQSQANPLNLIPMLLGKLIGGVGERAGGIVAPPGSGPVREAVGRGVTEAVEQAPGFLGAKAPAAATAAKGAIEGLAANLMQSALKPDLASRRTGKATSAVKTLLDEGINVSKGGAEKMTEQVSALNDRIAQVIDASPAVIDKDLVATRLLTPYNKFLKQVNATDDLAAIQRSWNQFLDHPLLQGKDIPVKTAQEMKQGTYKALGDKSYGELKGADIEAQKALARGLKEEIAKAVPEVRQLNAQESQLLNALSLVERRVLQSANKNPIGLGWLSTNGAKLAGWMAERSDLFKSLVARMLNTTAQGMPAAGRAGIPVGMALTSQAQQPPPIPPQ